MFPLSPLRVYAITYKVEQFHHHSVQRLGPLGPF